MKNKNINNKYQNYKNYEHFFGLPIGPIKKATGGGSANNTSSAKTKVKSKKNIDIKTNINRETVVNSLNKLVNDVVNDVAQKNSVDIINTVATSNRLQMSGIECDTIVINGNKQNSRARARTISKVKQKQENKLTSSISNSIKKKITNSLPSNTNEIQNKNNEMIKQFSKSVPAPGLNGALDIAKKLIKGATNHAFGNKKDVKNEIFNEESLKKTLNLNESFKVNDNDEISNTIKNSVKQDNLTKCASAAAANNEISLHNIKCGKGIAIKNNEQEASSQSLLHCTIKQEIKNEIVTKVTNTLDKLFQNMYNSAKDDDSLKRIGAFAQSVGENLRNASNISPPQQSQNNKRQIANSDRSDSDLDSVKDYYFDGNQINQDNNTNSRLPNSNKILFLGLNVPTQQRNIIIIIGIIITIIILFILLKSNSSKQDKVFIGNIL